MCIEREMFISISLVSKQLFSRTENCYGTCTVHYAMELSQRQIVQQTSSVQICDFVHVVAGGYFPHHIVHVLVRPHHFPSLFHQNS